MTLMSATSTALPLRRLYAVPVEEITKEEILQAIDDLRDHLLDLRRMAERYLAADCDEGDDDG